MELGAEPTSSKNRRAALLGWIQPLPTPRSYTFPESNNPQFWVRGVVIMFNRLSPLIGLTASWTHANFAIHNFLWQMSFSIKLYVVKQSISFIPNLPQANITCSALIAALGKVTINHFLPVLPYLTWFDHFLYFCSFLFLNCRIQPYLVIPPTVNTSPYFISFLTF